VIRLALLFLVAAAVAQAADPLRVVTLSTVLTEIAATVGGPDVAVTGLVRPGVDPHEFEPAPADLRPLARADLVLASGLGLESYLDRLSAHVAPRARFASAGAALSGTMLYTPGTGRPEPDPHWWNSVAAAIRVTRWTEAEFIALRPAAAPALTRRADAYVGKLAALDQWARGEVARIPPARRQLVTTHDAFGWFARDYGFRISFISGISPDAEPSARDFAALIDRIRRERIPAIFVENSANPRLVDVLCRETGAVLGGSLYADGLSAEGDGATYPGMVRHNVSVIVAALR
jgi:zinc/manganese transport system substrate-binding protein